MIMRPVSAPASIISLDEAKAQLRVLSDSEDDLITSYIDAFSTAVDGPRAMLGRAIRAQSWKWVTACFHPKMLVPVPGATAVTAISYFDDDDAEQSLTAGSAFYVIERDDGILLERKSDVQLPQTRDRSDAVSITVSAGGTAAPKHIKQAALLTVTSWFEQRSVGDIPDAAVKLLDLDRSGWVAA